ncbi:MAG: hypothetical protein ACTS73_05150 [Arsenophonus sp. NEOnobi-MAG3]
MIPLSAGVIIGATEHRRKELLEVEDAYRDSEANLGKLFNGLRATCLNFIL